VLFYIYIHPMCDYRQGFELDIGFIDHFNIQLVIALNYSDIVNFHNSQITIAPATRFPTCYVFPSRSLVMASKSGDCSASALKSFLNVGSLPTVPFLHRLLYRTDLVASIVLLITLYTVPNSTFIVA
jgi:hypothetical protein